MILASPGVSWRLLTSVHGTSVVRLKCLLWSTFLPWEDCLRINKFKCNLTTWLHVSFYHILDSLHLIYTCLFMFADVFSCLSPCFTPGLFCEHPTCPGLALTPPDRHKMRRDLRARFPSWLSVSKQKNFKRTSKHSQPYCWEGTFSSQPLKVPPARLPEQETFRSLTQKKLAVLATLTSRAPQFCWMHHQPKEIRDGGHQPGHGRHKLRENLFQILLPRYHKFVIVNSLLSRYRKSIPEIWSPALTSSSARRVPIEHKWHFAQCVLRCSAIHGAKAVKCGQGHTTYWPPMAS